MSDGVTECPDSEGNELGAQGLIDLLPAIASLPSPQLLEALVWELNRFSDGADFPDDVSGLMLDYLGKR